MYRVGAWIPSEPSLSLVWIWVSRRSPGTQERMRALSSSPTNNHCITHLVDSPGVSASGIEEVHQRRSYDSIHISWTIWSNYRTGSGTRAIRSSSPSKMSSSFLFAWCYYWWVSWDVRCANGTGGFGGGLGGGGGVVFEPQAHRDRRLGHTHKRRHTRIIPAIISTSEPINGGGSWPDDILDGVLARGGLWLNNAGDDTIACLAITRDLEVAGTRNTATWPTTTIRERDHDSISARSCLLRACVCVCVWLEDMVSSRISRWFEQGYRPIRT